MRIAFFGYQEIGYVCLNELIRLKEDVALVVTHKDALCEEIWFHSVERLATENKIPISFVEEKIDWSVLKERLAAAVPDLLFSAYFRQVIPKEILTIPRLGAINLHGSLLPKYRGRAPVNWAILKGERISGLTFHFMEKQPDSGDIILQIKIPIGPSDEAKDFYRKMYGRIPKALNKVLRMFRENRVIRIRQDESRATKFGRRKPEDGRINWNLSAHGIKNLVRALARPWPGAYAAIRGEKVYVWKTSYKKRRGSQNIANGTVTSISKRDGIRVLCGDGFLCCKELQLEGAESIDGARFAKRYGLKQGDVFE